MAQGRRFVDLAWELPSQRMESLGGDVMAEALEQRGDRCFGLPWELPSQLGRCRSLGSCQVSAWNRCEVVFWQRLWSKGVKICWSRWGAAKSAHGIVGSWKAALWQRLWGKWGEDLLVSIGSCQISAWNRWECRYGRGSGAKGRQFLLISLGSCQVSAWNRWEVSLWQRLWSKGAKMCWSRLGVAK